MTFLSQQDSYTMQAHISMKHQQSNQMNTIDKKSMYNNKVLKKIQQTLHSLHSKGIMI